MRLKGHIYEARLLSMQETTFEDVWPRSWFRSVPHTWKRRPRSWSRSALHTRPRGVSAVSLVVRGDDFGSIVLTQKSAEVS